MLFQKKPRLFCGCIQNVSSNIELKTRGNYSSWRELFLLSRSNHEVRNLDVRASMESTARCLLAGPLGIPWSTSWFFSFFPPLYSEYIQDSHIACSALCYKKLLQKTFRSAEGRKVKSPLRKKRNETWKTLKITQSDQTGEQLLAETFFFCLIK